MELTLSFICTPLSPSVHPKPFDNLPAFLLAICSSQNMNFFLSYLTMEFLNILLFYFCCMKGRIYSWNLPAPPPTQMLQKFLGVNVQVYTQKLLGFQHHKLWKLKIVPNKVFSSSIFKKQKKIGGNFRSEHLYIVWHLLTKSKTRTVIEMLLCLQKKMSSFVGALLLPNDKSYSGGVANTRPNLFTKIFTKVKKSRR